MEEVQNPLILCVKTSCFQAVTGLRGTTTVTLSTHGGVTPSSRKVVGYWLLGCSGMVFGAVVLGNFSVLELKQQYSAQIME
jgi:hypothetical protein